MNFAQATLEVAERLHDTSPTNLARVREWLNLAKDEIVAFSNDWDWLQTTSDFTTTAGEHEYPLGEIGGDVEYILTLRIETDGPRVLLPLTPDFADHLEPDPDLSSGIPERYTVHADTLIIWPVPDDAYSIHARYYRSVDDFVDDEEEAPWPRKWDRVWLEGGEYFGLLFNDDRRADQKERKFQVGMHKMLAGKDHGRPLVVMSSFTRTGRRHGSPFPVHRFPQLH